MANSPQARKRARQNKQRELHNTGQRSAVRTAIKKTLKSFQPNNQEAAKLALKQAVKVIDKAAGRGTIHRNKANRLKQRLHRKLNTLNT